jgi:hypothetical protein
MVDTTTNFKLIKVALDKIPWNNDINGNFSIIDAMLARYISVNDVQGIWANAQAVTVGQRWIDPDAEVIYEVLVASTTPSTGTFAAARTATSTQWQGVTIDQAFKGTWATGTAYVVNDFVVDSGRYGVVAIAHTSVTSYNTGVTAGNIVTLVDASEIIDTTHSTNTVATGGTPTATYSASTSKFDFGLVTGATGATGATGPGSGTVTQINAGDGFSFSAITTTGTIAVDGVLQDLDTTGVVGANGEFLVGTGAGAMAWESSSTAFTSIKQAATASATGVVELLTNAELATGTDTTRAATAANIESLIVGKTDTTVAAGDSFIFEDVTDNAMKKDTIQGILDLAPEAGLTLITSTTPSAAATVVFTGFDSSKYRGYMWMFSNIATATDNKELHMRTSTDGGSSYDSSSGDYEWSAYSMSGGATTATGDGSLSATEIKIGGANFPQGTTSDENFSGQMWCYSPDDTHFTRFTYALAGQEDNANYMTCNGGGARQSAADVDAVQFLWESGGNFVAQGNISLYGLTRS